MTDPDMSRGWYFRRSGDQFESGGGPCSWVDLVSLARQGVLSPEDIVWHASYVDWAPAASIPRLFAQPVAGSQDRVVQSASPAAQPPLPVTQGPAPQPAAESPKRGSRVGAVIAIAAATVLLFTAVGGAAWWLLGRSSGATGGGPNLGVAETKLPDTASLVATQQWGEVPANQLCVTLVDDGKRKDAEALAKALGGSIVGEIEFINAYQIEFSGTTEEELAAALDAVQADPKVEAAFPNQQDRPDTEIWGVREDPFTDPVYGNGAGDGLEVIGVSKAWSYIKGSGLELGDVKVGVVDSGLYKSGEGRESEFGGDVEFEYPDKSAGERAEPQVWDDGVTNPAGTHGTAVMNIIAADPDNGGPSGIAAPLGKKLKVSVIDKYVGQYGEVTTTTADADDPTKATIGEKSYVFGTLVAIQKQIENKATVINCSFGLTDGHPAVAAAYKKFFEKMATEHPEVLFVCSAGNEGEAVDGSKRFPSGHALPNMITVGALDNDGHTAGYSNKRSDNYEVTLGAPGTQAVVGLKSEGGSERQDGTSFATPHVTSAAAILKSLNPDLQAGDIKRILTETARTRLVSVDANGWKTTLGISNDVGGKILAVDEAVFKVINEMRKTKGLAELTRDDMQNMGVVDAVAVTGEPGEYAVRGIAKGVGPKGTSLTITVQGEDHAVGGTTTQAINSPGEISWNVTLPKENGTIRVTRKDNGAASLITIERGALEGTWQFPEVIRLPGGPPQYPGGQIEIVIVRKGDGYGLAPPWEDAIVTLNGNQVKIVHEYLGGLNSEGGVSTFSGTLDGDTITGKEVDTYNGTLEWNAKRIK